MARNLTQDAGASDIRELAQRIKDTMQALDTLDVLVAGSVPGIAATLALAAAALASPHAAKLAPCVSQALSFTQCSLDILLDNVSTEVRHG